MAEDKNYTNNTERPREDEELEIDLMEYVRKLWAARKMLLKVAGIGAIVGVIIALSIPKQYTVEVTLSPESGKSGGGSLSGMAAMLGIGGMSLGSEADALNVSLFPDIVASTPFILELFNAHVTTLDGEVDTTFVAYLDEQKAPWWGAVMLFWFCAGFFRQRFFWFFRRHGYCFFRNCRFRFRQTDIRLLLPFLTARQY